ncbi:MAG: Ig-like domain-containing protein [Burkholderiaceae bacterium]
MTDGACGIQRISSFRTWSAALLFAALAAACGGQDSVLGSNGIVNTVVPPTVTATAPIANARAVPINSRFITAAFSEAMDPSTLTAATFTLACPIGGAIAGTVSYLATGNVATLTLPATGVLPASTICTATITAGAKNTIGVGLAAPYTWTFTTGVASDTIPPTVSSTIPTTAATGVATNALLTATFSKAMDPLTVTNATFVLACPAGTPTAGTVGYAVSGNIATFKPSAILPPRTVCSATITVGAKDLAGNPLAAPYTWTFTTAAIADVIPPIVSSTVPARAAVGVAFNAAVTATFSEPMDALTITTGNFVLACPSGTSTGGAVSYLANGNVATFTPTASLPPSTTCTATITTGVRDVAGNALVVPYSWTFTTGAVADTTAPTVTSTVPAPSATGVATNAGITATFSKAMNAATITATTFSLVCPAGTATTGTVGYAVNGNIATFTPSANLPASTLCQATISTAAKDVAGNALAAPFVWTFTTGAGTDTIPPTVVSSNPIDLAIGICVNKTVNVTFSEAMDPLTITNATVLLSQTNGPAVTGVVAYDAATRIASFRPSANLIGTPATNYTVTIKSGAAGVKDLAGNALAADRVSTFTTNASTCATAPALGAASPFGGFGGNATLTNDGLNTIITGDIGVNASSTKITGLQDTGGNVYTITPNNRGLVNGLVYTLTAPPGSVAGAAVTQARADALTAFNAISPASLPGGIDVSSLAQCPSCGGALGGPDELAGRTLPPGVYLSASGTYDIGGSSRPAASLTLDAGGDTNAVWIFQTAAGNGTLNVGLTGPATPAVPIQVQLINGAQAKNVFWYTPAGAVIGTGSTMVGTILADATITLSTTGGSPPTAVVTTLNGRAIALTAAVTMTNTVINRPAP